MLTPRVNSLSLLTHSRDVDGDGLLDVLPVEDGTIANYLVDGVYWNEGGLKVKPIAPQLHSMALPTYPRSPAGYVSGKFFLRVMIDASGIDHTGASLDLYTVVRPIERTPVYSMRVSPSGDDNLCGPSHPHIACATPQRGLELVQASGASSRLLYIEAGEYILSDRLAFVGSPSPLYVVIDPEGITLRCEDQSRVACLSFTSTNVLLSFNGGPIHIVADALQPRQSPCVRMQNVDGTRFWPAFGHICVNETSGEPIINCFSQHSAGRNYRYDATPVPNSEVHLSVTGCKNELSDGGAFAITDSNDIDIARVRCSSSSSTSGRGGCFYISNSLSVILSSVSISEATSEHDGGGIYSMASDVELVNFTCSASQSLSKNGGCIASEAGGLRLVDSSFLNCVSSTGCGGAISVSSGTSIVGVTGFTNVSFTSNSANTEGGAVCVDATPMIFSQCVFTDNVSGQQGGALSVLGSNMIAVRDSDFSGNSAGSFGGALSCRQGGVEMEAVEMRINTGVDGGAIHLDECSLTGERIILQGNAADQAGGAVVCETGAVKSTAPSLSLSYSKVTENAAGGLYGGGIASLKCDFSLSHSDVSSNTVEKDGGGVYIQLIHPRTGFFMNSTISSNTAKDGSGGNIYVVIESTELFLSDGTMVSDGEALEGGGGGLYVSQASALGRVIIDGNSSVTSNTAAYSNDVGTPTDHTSVTVTGEEIESSGSLLRRSVMLEVLDANNQRIRKGPWSTATVVCSSSSEGAAVIGSGSWPLFWGRVDLRNNIGFIASPGSTVTISCEVSIDGAAEVFSFDSFSVDIRRCGPGEREEASVCVDCPVGKVSVDGSGCTQCPDGTSANSTGLSLCSECGDGFTSSRLNDDCQECAPGQYSNSSTGYICELCPEGFVAAANRSVCVPCGFGTQANAARTDCGPCPSGSISSNETDYLCSVCGEGKHQSKDQSFCELCDPGRFSTNLSVNTECGLCPTGHFSSDYGATKCDPCPEHTFAAVAGSSICEPCDVTQGVYQFLNGSDRCLSCKISEYAVVATNLSSSPTSTNLDSNDTGAANSSKGSSSPSLSTSLSPTHLSRKSLTFHRCDACPPNVLCNASMYVIPAERVWLSRSASGELFPFQCPPDLCDDGKCPLGHIEFNENPLCGMCAEGFSKANQKCVECEEANGGLFFFLLLTSFCFIAAFHVFSQRKGGAFKIIVYFIQMSLLLIGSHNGFVLHILEVFNSNLLQVAGEVCVLPLSPIQRISFSFAMRFLPFLQLALVATIWLTYCHMVRNTFIEEKYKFQRSFVALFLFQYNSIVTSSFSFFHCVTVNYQGSDIELMWSEPDVRCSDPSVQTLRAFAILALILCVGIIPATLMYFARRAFNERRNVSVAYGVTLGILTDSYKHSWYFYEIVVLARRALIVCLVVFLSQDRIRMFVAVGCANVLIYVIHSHVSPFQLSVDNIWEGVSLILLSCLPYLLMVWAEPFSASQSVVLLMFVLVPLCFFCVQFGRRAANRFFQSGMAVVRSYSSKRKEGGCDGLMDGDADRNELGTSSSQANIGEKEGIELGEFDSIVAPPSMNLPDVPSTLIEREREHHSSQRATDFSSPTSNNVPPPSGWVQYEDDNGFPYYHNPVSGETSWEVPS